MNWICFTTVLGFLLAMSFPRAVALEDSKYWLVMSESPLSFTADIQPLVTKVHTPPKRRTQPYTNYQTGKRTTEQRVTLYYLYRIRATSDTTMAPSAIIASFGIFSTPIVEPNIQFKLLDTTTEVGTNSWSLDRLNQVNLPLDGYTTRHQFINGSQQDVYIFDTGIYPHSSFDVPIAYDYDAFNLNSPCHCDPHGHGSHVAGLVGSSLYGVAPRTQIHSMRVIHPDGYAYLDDIIAALQWFIAHAPDHPCVLSMSLGSQITSPTMTNLLNSIVNDYGHIIIAAAGNDYKSDACFIFPANLPSVIGIGASDITDQIAFFSNLGPCVDIYAPGHNVLSVNNSYTGSAIKSGTSMSTPIMSGMAALVLQAKAMYADEMQIQSALSVRTILVDYLSTSFDPNVSGNDHVPLLAYLNYSLLYANPTFWVSPSPTPEPAPPQVPPPPPPPPPSRKSSASSLSEESQSTHTFMQFCIVGLILFILWA